ELDQQGMVCDFGTVKKQIRRWPDEELDHRLAVPVRSPQIRIQDEGDFLEIYWAFGNKGEFLHTRSPRSAIALVDAQELTPESVADWCIAQLKTLFPESVARLELQFECEKIDGAFYHYSHGLKKHGGNCQRIAHGHRSRIDIWANQQKSAVLEQLLAERWRELYTGTRADIAEGFEDKGNTYYRFAYVSAQGAFELSLPQRCCYLIDTDATVEFLAHHIANRSRAENPDKKIRV